MSDMVGGKDVMSDMIGGRGCNEGYDWWMLWYEERME